MTDPDSLTPPRPQKTLRIFIGLWPSPEDAAKMMDWARAAHAQFGGRMLRQENLHLTLAFIGNTAPERVAALQQAASTWQLRAHPLTLHRIGRFTGPRIIWAGPTRRDEDRIPWLDAMHERVWQHLGDLGWTAPPEIFRPHVSLLRKAGPGRLDALSFDPLTWMPQRCVLVRSTPSEGGSRYEALAQIPMS